MRMRLTLKGFLWNMPFAGIVAALGAWAGVSLWILVPVLVLSLFPLIWWRDIHRRLTTALDRQSEAS